MAMPSCYGTIARASKLLIHLEPHAMLTVPANEPLFRGNEKKYLVECIESGWISSEGPFVQRFEEDMAQRVARKFGIAVCNGSLALDAAVATLHLGPGDEVIMP